MGSPAMVIRIALCVFIIKKRLGTSDEETVEQIRKNPYLQYFLVFKKYKGEMLFHPTMNDSESVVGLCGGMRFAKSKTDDFVKSIKAVMPDPQSS